VLAACLLRDGLPTGMVMLSSEAVQQSLPWSAVMEREPAHNRFLADQSRVTWPYLRLAEQVYRGAEDALWTPHGGGGLPFLGNMVSSLLHPLTLLAAVLPLERVPLVAAFLVLVLSAHFTYLFLRRLRLGFAAALCGGLAFGFGGHQVAWLQSPASHTLLALPFCFWAVERLVEDRSRGRVAVLAAGFALLVFGGHPETAFVSTAVAALWALWRLWDAHGRFLVVGALLLGLALSAVQWLPFLEYALESHGMALRLREAERSVSGVTWGAAFIFGLFLLAALALLRAATEKGMLKRLVALVSGIVVLVMARRMGMAVSASTVLLPQLYGTPVGGGAYTGAQDFPALAGLYVGVLPALLLAIGALAGLGGGFVRFFGIGSLLLWGTAFHMPAVETFVRVLPGVGRIDATHLLGPAAFLVACGGAMVLDILCNALKPGVLGGVRRVALTTACVVAGGWLVLSVQDSAVGGRTVIAGLLSPVPEVVHDGSAPVPIRVPLTQPAEDLTIVVDGRTLRSGPAAVPPGGLPVQVLYLSQRGEEGVHWLRVEVTTGGARSVVADQPLVIWRERRLLPRDAAAAAASIALLALLLTGRRALLAGVAVLVVGADVFSFGHGYNAATPASRLFPPTRTVDFLKQQQPPFRIFTEGNILPPDTACALGLDHLLSQDSLGYHHTYQWLLDLVDMDASARGTFSRENVAYGNPRFDALDVRYILTAPGTGLFDIEGLRLVHESETRVWENTQNLGRVFVVGSALNLLRDRPEDLSRADPRVTAFLEATLATPLGGRGTARVTGRSGGRLTAVADIEGEALLVLAENRGPGWLCSVDGGEARPTLACDVAWQAVPLGSGRHELVFWPDSPAFRWGRGVSLVALALLLAMLLVPRRFS
jgi:hypothetical protein